jgi:hypothetical protein
MPYGLSWLHLVRQVGGPRQTQNTVDVLRPGDAAELLHHRFDASFNVIDDGLRFRRKNPDGLPLCIDALNRLRQCDGLVKAPQHLNAVAAVDHKRRRGLKRLQRGQIAVFRCIGWLVIARIEIAENEFDCRDIGLRRLDVFDPNRIDRKIEIALAVMLLDEIANLLRGLDSSRDDVALDLRIDCRQLPRPPRTQQREKLNSLQRCGLLSIRFPPLEMIGLVPAQVIGCERDLISRECSIRIEQAELALRLGKIEIDHVRTSAAKASAATARAIAGASAKRWCSLRACRSMVGGC